MLAHPQIARRDCGLCQKYCWDEDKHVPLRTSSKQLIPRPPGNVPPCRTVGCPKGTPENPRELTAQNKQAYEHYRECRAIGNFPDDPVVARNARIIRDVEDAYAETKQAEFQSALMQIALVKSVV